jgi:hypothetical protein
MRKVRDDEAGVSEIVGALLLTLIVVMAAASFAVFVSQRQSEIQEQRLLENKRALENVRIMGIKPTADGAGTSWIKLNFTIASIHNEISRVTRIDINGYAVKEFDLLRFNASAGSYEWASLSYNDRFEISPLERLNLVVETPMDLFDSAASLLTSDSLKIEIYTAFLNSFNRVFMPPTAIARIITEVQWDSGSADYKPFLILDGTYSVLYNDTYAVEWDWTILGDDDGDGVFGETGEVNATRSGVKSAADFPVTGITYKITLNITDNNGMRGNYVFEHVF